MDLWKERERRADYRSAVVACMIYNAHRDTQTTQPLEPADLFASIPRQRREMSDAEIVAALERWCASMGGVDTTAKA